MNSNRLIQALFTLSFCGFCACSGAVVDTVVTVDKPASTLRDPPRLKSMNDDVDTGAEDLSRSDDNNSDEKLVCSLNAPLPVGFDDNLEAGEYHSAGQKMILARDGSSALPLLQYALKKDADNAKILGDMGTALLQCGLYKEAVTYVEKAVSIEPDNVFIIANMAQTYQIAGRISDAIKAYKNGIKIDPNDPSLRNNLAVLLIVIKDLQGAERQIRKALTIDPESVNYLVNLSYVLARQKRYNDAETVVKRAIKFDPKSPDAFNQLGLILAAQGRNQEASVNFKRAVELKPTHKGARENLNAVDEGFDFEGPWKKSN